jgi:hypothetical protein
MAARWGPGYRREELERAQERFGLHFPPDLVTLLLDRRLLDGHDWNDPVAIRKMLAWPLEGLLFDVEQNELWLPEWGVRPGRVAERSEIVSSAVAKAPKLIPIYSHRFLPAEPNEAGNPVLSVYQSDIIYYGADLRDYLVREFGGQRSRRPLGKVRRIRFWSDIIDL